MHNHLLGQAERNARSHFARDWRDAARKRLMKRSGVTVAWQFYGKSRKEGRRPN